MASGLETLSLWKESSFYRTYSPFDFFYQTTYEKALAEKIEWRDKSATIIQKFQLDNSVHCLLFVQKAIFVVSYWMSILKLYSMELKAK